MGSPEPNGWELKLAGVASIFRAASLNFGPLLLDDDDVAGPPSCPISMSFIPPFFVWLCAFQFVRASGPHVAIWTVDTMVPVPHQKEIRDFHEYRGRHVA